MKRLKVLITGAHGFIGRNAALYFKNMGHYVYGAGHGDWEKPAWEKYGIDEWIGGNIDKKTLGRGGRNVEIFVNCAGSSSVKKTFERPVEELQRTLQPIANLLEYIREYSPAAKLLHLSSAAVYGSCTDGPIREEQALHPASLYGLHKKMAEDLISYYVKQYRLSATVLRLFSVYGPGLEKQLLWDCCRKMYRTHEAIFFGTGEETRDWLYIDDAVSLIYILSTRQYPFSVINGGTGRRVKVLELIEEVRSRLAPECKIRMNMEARTGDPRHYLADISKLCEVGFKPQTDLGAGIERYVNWFVSLDDQMKSQTSEIEIQ